MASETGIKPRRGEGKTWSQSAPLLPASRHSSMVAHSSRKDRNLFDSFKSLVQANNVSPEILTVRATVLIGTNWSELVVSSDIRSKTDVWHVLHIQVAVRP